MNRYQKIICFGEVLWDILPTGAEPGGAPLNVAIHLKKQGHAPVLISKVGKDKKGKDLLQFLAESGIDTNYIQTTHDLPTSEVLIHLDAKKNANYEICEPVAWDTIQYTSEVDTSVKSADLLIFGTLASRNSVTLNTLLKVIDNTNAQKLLDVNLRSPYDSKDHVEQFIHLSDFVKLNNDELIRIAGWRNILGTESKLTNWFIDFYNCQTLCVTRGDKGAALFTEGKRYEHPGFKVNAVDTVGAGDSFLAGLVSSLSKNRSPEKSLEIACATGAFVASQKGAVPSYTEKDIENLRRPES